MAPDRIVEAIDIMSDRSLGLPPCLKACAPDEFRFDCLEDGLNDGIEAPIFVKPVLVRFLVRRGG